MKVIDYFNNLRTLIETYPECKEMEIIYSHDDEGNAYQKVYNAPSLFQVQDLEERYLEPEIDISETMTNPNCVIIN